jgi:hypothetical protein
MLSGLAIGLVHKESDFKHDLLLITGLAIFMLPRTAAPNAVYLIVFPGFDMVSTSRAYFCPNLGMIPCSRFQASSVKYQ